MRVMPNIGETVIFKEKGFFYKGQVVSVKEDTLFNIPMGYTALVKYTEVQKGAPTPLYPMVEIDVDTFFVENRKPPVEKGA